MHFARPTSAQAFRRLADGASADAPRRGQILNMLKLSTLNVC